VSECEMWIRLKAVVFGDAPISKYEAEIMAEDIEKLTGKAQETMAKWEGK
jgi:hypothetical protein